MNYASLIPENTFISEYMRASSVLETASAYDFWGAVWALGSVLGRGVYVPRPHSPVHMNWYIMFVAESGTTRKSTAVRLARDIVSSFLGQQHMIEGRCTPEYLFDNLTRNPHTAIAVSELVTFLGREGYVIELPALLTDLYDCPRERRGGSIGRGEKVVSDAFVTFLTASTPSWLRTSVNPTVVEGGFTSRCLFIHDEKSKAKVPWPVDHVDTGRAQEHLQIAVAVAQNVRKIELMPAAMKRYETWYKSRDTSSIVPFVSSFNAREDSHVLRLAACLCINDHTYAIDRNHMTTAIKLISLVKVHAVQLFADGNTVLKSAQGIDRITQMLIEAGPIGIPHSRLYIGTRYFFTRDDFRIAIDMMNEMNMITVMVDNRAGGGKKGLRYARADGLMNRNKINELRDAFAR